MIIGIVTFIFMSVPEKNMLTGCNAKNSNVILMVLKMVLIICLCRVFFLFFW